MIRLVRHTRPLPVVSIIPLVDVLLILLVFFMVTSTFLNLDMMPLSESESGRISGSNDSRSQLVRVLPGGDIVSGNERISREGISAFLFEQQSARILLLPSPQTELQALVYVLDTAAKLGLPAVSVVQFGESE